MARPLTGARKREKLNSTFDPELIAKARLLALRKGTTLPQVIEELIKRETEKISRVDEQLAKDVNAVEKTFAALLRQKRS